LGDGTTLAQARAEMNVIAKNLERADPALNAGHGANVFPLDVEDVSPILRRSLVVLQFAVALVLLIACANVANLLLARAVGREREIAIRVALGAGRRRLVRQMLSESLLLSVLGGAAGLLLALWALDAVALLAPGEGHGVRELRIDPVVLGFTVAASLAAGLLFGLTPALHASGQNVVRGLNRGPRAGGGSHRLRNALVVSEIALSLILLAGAGLMIRSLASLMAVDNGFRTDHLLKVRIALPESKYSKPEQVAMFGDRLLEEVRALPGVRSATLANGVPMQEVSIGNYRLEGAAVKPGDSPACDIARVREGYFETLGLKLLRGRTFTRRDLEHGRPISIVVNESFARRNWPGEDALGKVVLSPDGADRHSVIGVVGDARALGPESEGRPQIYFAELHLQSPMLLVRTAGDPMALLPAVEKRVWSIDKDQPVYSAGTMESVLRDFTSQRRFNMTVLGVFACAALVLAAVGLYGVLAYSVTLRTREIGVRVAMGADPRAIARLVVGQGFVLALVGTGVGLTGAFALTRLMQGMVYGVSAADPYTYALVAAILMAVALAASYIPARRAARIEPMEALRAD
jgi:putative ABC transport system permease protein